MSWPDSFLMDLPREDVERLAAGEVTETVKVWAAYELARSLVLDGPHLVSPPRRRRCWCGQDAEVTHVCTAHRPLRFGW